MIIGIISAMEEELIDIIEESVITREEIKAGMKFNFGSYFGKEVVLVVSGIGKVNAAICTQILIDDFDVDKVINVGVAGGLGVDIEPGDVVIGSSLVQHDMDTSYFGDKIGQIPRVDTFDFISDKQLVFKAQQAFVMLEKHKCFVGRIVTGDQFISQLDKIKWLHDEFGAIACEMEGASIAQVCYLNNKPFVIIRSISDNSLTGSHMDYEKFKPIAIKNSTFILKNMLNLI